MITFFRPRPDVNKLKKEKNLKALRRALFFKKDWQVRRDAARVLGEIGDESSAEVLLGAFGSESDWSVRSAIISALGSLNPPHIGKLLEEALRDRQESVRHDAMKTLPSLIGPKCRQVCISALQDPYSLVRQAAIQALGDFADPMNISCIALCAHDNDPYVREASFTALSKIGKPAVQTINDLLQRASTITASYDAESGILAAGPRCAIAPHFGDLEDSKARQAAVCCLRFHGKRGIALLLEAAEEKDTRGTAIETLGKTRDSGTIETLVAMLAPETSFSLRHALVAFGKDVIGPLTARMGDREPGIRAEVLAILGTIDPDAATEITIRALNDKDKSVRWNALSILRNSSSQSARQPVIEALEDPDKGLREEAARIIADKKIREAVEPLISALRDPARGICSLAAHALGRIGDRRAVQPLIQALATTDDYVTQMYSIRALAAIGDDRAISHLIKLANHPVEKWKLLYEIAPALEKMANPRTVSTLLSIATTDWPKGAESEESAKVCAVKGLETVLAEKASQIEAHDLSSIMDELGDTITCYHYGGDDDAGYWRTIDCRRIREAAEAELERRERET